MSVQTTKEDEGTAENPTLVPSTEHARLIGCLCMYTGLKLLVFNLTLDQEFFSNIVMLSVLTFQMDHKNINKYLFC
jgi:hypothetical protein